MEPSDKIRRWLENSDRKVGSVVHTIDGRQPVRATLTPEGWKFELEDWTHVLIEEKTKGQP